MPQNTFDDKPTWVQVMAIIWANVDPDLCHHMALLGHSELMMFSPWFTSCRCLTAEKMFWFMDNCCLFMQNKFIQLSEKFDVFSYFSFSSWKDNKLLISIWKVSQITMMSMCLVSFNLSSYGLHGPRPLREQDHYNTPDNDSVVLEKCDCPCYVFEKSMNFISEKVWDLVWDRQRVGLLHYESGLLFSNKIKDMECEYIF